MALTLPLPTQLFQILLDVDLKSAMNIFLSEIGTLQNLIVYSHIYIYIYITLYYSIL